MKFDDEFDRLFPIPEHCYLSDVTARIEKVAPDLIEIRYGAMYQAPALNLDRLLAIGALFGTKAVDVDDYANGGCETCDYGSDYGHTIQVRRPSKNIAEAAKLKAARDKTNWRRG